jgi:hypothetical protein
VLRRMSGVWPMVSEKDWRMGMVYVFSGGDVATNFTACRLA